MSPRAWLATALCALACWLPLVLLVALAHAHVPGCHDRRCDRRVHVKRAQRWCRTHARCVWKHRFHAETVAWQGWARNTGACESHNNAGTNTGNGYFGALQFDLRTAREAGFHARPDLTTIYEQYVRAIELAQRVGTGRWPVCGR